MEKTDTEIRTEIIHAVKRMERGHLEKLHIFVEGLTAARQRDAPQEENKNGMRKGE